MPMPSRNVRQALMFVVISGTGWLLDTAVFLLLSGPGSWPVIAANIASSCCGVLLVFIVSSRSIFQRNEGSMLQKVLVLLLFNATVILASSVVLGLIATQLTQSATRLDWAVTPGMVRLAAKVLVTPVTLALNFVVVRLLLERFIGIGSRPATTLQGGAR